MIATLPTRKLTKASVRSSRDLLITGRKVSTALMADDTTTLNEQTFFESHSFYTFYVEGRGLSCNAILGWFQDRPRVLKIGDGVAAAGSIAELIPGADEAFGQRFK
jgi:hypothetical protein